MIELRYQMIAAQMNEFGAKVVNVSCLMNMAFDKDGTGSPHVHYHLKPRYYEPVSRFGYTFIDRQFGSYIKDKYPNDVDHETAKKIAGVLRAAVVV